MTSWVRSKYSILNPNNLSVLRGVIGIALPFMILSGSNVWHDIACVLFILGAITDYWDGRLARKYQIVSAFGKFVDPLTDKVLILAPLVAFSLLGLFSIWWLVPLFFREIVVTFCRTAWLFEGKAIGAEKLGKWKFGLQTGSVGVAFAVVVFWDYPITEILGRFFSVLLVPVLVIAIILTLISGFSFLWNQRAHFSSQYFKKFLLATGVGLLPKAPGTWGSTLGLLLVFLTSWNLPLYLVVAVALAAVGDWAFRKLEDKSNKDPQYIVLDEVLGIFTTFFLIPLSWPSAILGFFLFRLFDVWKPFPVRTLEKIPGYWGIVLDDIAAGIYAWIILFLIFR